MNENIQDSRNNFQFQLQGSSSFFICFHLKTALARKRNNVHLLLYAFDNPKGERLLYAL